VAAKQPSRDALFGHIILSIFFPCVDFRAIEKLPIVIGVIGNLLPSASSLASYEPPAGLPKVDRLAKPAPRHKSPCGMDALQECDETSPESPLEVAYQQEIMKQHEKHLTSTSQ